ncbi:unnamed protein product [Thlaspi arvense]|uniref:Uncharacterized protein n=1 Tax=Thlaspi arvense TaxID=13288 RepID=A0AAU9RS84_THLAR|nr:unnamed protein product [Thlaspi arvense]
MDWLCELMSLVTVMLPFVYMLLKDFLIWVEHDLGPWGPLVLAIAYIPLTILAVPASVLTSARRIYRNWPLLPDQPI